MRSEHTTILLAAMGLVSLTALPRCVDAAEGQLDFGRDIRPILSDKCFHCHGPDSETREADLRLDSPHGLFGDRGGYAAVVPGKPDNSEAIRRITSADKWEQMPPPDSKRRLSSREKELLTRWVQQGAEVRNPESVRESFNADGWSGARSEHRLERAKAIYEACAGPKVIAEHERLREAVQLFEIVS